MTDGQRISIIKMIITHTLFLGELRKECDGIIEFLEMIWELRTMPSDDNRFSTAYEDAWQHLVNNDDWSYEYTFLDRFPSCYKDEEAFNKFVSFSVHPSLFSNEVERCQLVDAINVELAKIGYHLVATDYFEQRVVYSIAPVV